MMFSAQQKKLLFIFFFYSLVGYFIDAWFQPTWMHSYSGAMRYVSFLIPSYGLAAILIYMLNKSMAKSTSMVMRVVSSVFIMLAFQCIMESGKAMLTDTFTTIGGCMDLNRAIMFSVLVVGFLFANKPIMRQFLGRKAVA